MISATIATAIIPALLIAYTFDAAFLSLIASTVCLATVGALDDLRPMPVLPRFSLQAIAVGLVLATLPEQFQLIQSILSGRSGRFCCSAACGSSTSSTLWTALIG